MYIYFLCLIELANSNDGKEFQQLGSLILLNDDVEAGGSLEDYGGLS